MILYVSWWFVEHDLIVINCNRHFWAEKCQVLSKSFVTILCEVQFFILYFWCKILLIYLNLNICAQVYETSTNFVPLYFHMLQIWNYWAHLLINRFENEIHPTAERATREVRKAPSFSGPLMLPNRASANSLSAPIKSSGGYCYWVSSLLLLLL